MKKGTPLALLLKGCLGVVLLAQTACNNTPSLGMEGESQQPDLGQPATSAPNLDGTTAPAAPSLDEVIDALELREELADDPAREYQDTLAEIKTELKCPQKVAQDACVMVADEKTDGFFILTHVLLAAFQLCKEVPVALLEAYYEQGGNINTPRGEFASLLDYASYYYHFPALRWLLEKGAKPIAVFSYEILSTIFSADVPKEEKIRLVKQAINNGLDMANEAATRAVKHFALQGNPEILDILLSVLNNIPQESQNILEKTIKYITVLKLVEASAPLEDEAPVERDRLFQELSLLYRRSN